MTVRIGHTTFDQVSYDRDADVLYLGTEHGGEAVEFDETPEGHHIRFNEAGELIGVTIVNARWLLEKDGQLPITMPRREVVTAAALRPALGVD